MKETLLTTKFQLPPMRKEFVPRPRLMAKLSHVLDRKLTVITAPAGFGKTTLVREWVESIDYPAAWLSLDSQDNAPVRFMSHLVYALREIAPNIGSEALALLQSTHIPQWSAVLIPLINDLAAFKPCILVLDDYHVIVNQAINEAVDFLIAHIPTNVHLVMTGRSQPALSLSRLRGQAQLLELDSADLRFTAVEVEKFLSDVMRLRLSPNDRIALEMRTEGWIAGLQLAGLSLQSEADLSAFITAFNGTDRHVEDYLFEEVLRHQPDEIRDFLLQTAIVDGLSSGLGDALLDTQGSQAMLEKLDQLCLFIVPLDRQRLWYRYHALFIELLRHHLHKVYPERLIDLHKRASIWYEHHGRLDEAIQHGLQAQDYERTAALIETAFQQRDWIHHDMHSLLTWFESLPGAIAESRSKLILAYTWLLLELFSDRWEQIESQLQLVEKILVSPASNRAFSDEDAALMLAQVDLLRANHARHDGQAERVIALCQQALARLPENETYIRSGTLAHLASVYETAGRVEEAGRLFTESIQMCRTAGNVDGLLFAASHLIQVCSLRGQLQHALKVFEETGEYTDRRNGPDVGMIYINIGAVCLEQNQVQMAKDLFQRGTALCRPFQSWHTALTTGEIGIAQVMMAEGHLDEAMRTLVEIGKQHPGRVELPHLESVRTRLQLRRGNLKAAAQWVQHSRLSDLTHSDYASEFDLLTYIRVLLAQASLETEGKRAVHVSDAALQDTDRLLKNLYRLTQAGGRVGRTIEVCMLQALTHLIQSDTSSALKWLQEALILAEPEGYIRMFVDEGLPMYQLLVMLRTRPISASISMEYLNTLRAAFPHSIRQNVAEGAATGGALTESELHTLRLLASNLSIEDIATELSVAVSTVRTYAKRIYSKLDVHSRAEAIYRARELNIV